MQEKDIQGILKKVEELKSVFTFGVKFIPFLEDLLVFVQEMAPMLNEMNRSIQDSSSKMPKAVQQLDKVTSATELATNEILDKVDSMLARLEVVNSNFSLIRQRLSAEHSALTSIAGAIEDLLVLPGVRESLNHVFENKKARDKGIEIKRIVDEFLNGKIDETVTEKVDQALHDTQSDAYDIMNALQVQDITTQQIEGAHALLRSVQERLNELLEKYSDATPPQELRESYPHDMQASFIDADERQKAADEAMSDTGEPEELLSAPELPESSAFEDLMRSGDVDQAGEPGQEEIEDLMSWGSDEQTTSSLPGEEDEAMLVLDEEIESADAAPGGDQGVETESIDLDSILEDNSEFGKDAEELNLEPELVETDPETKSDDSKNAADKSKEEEINLKISQEEIDKLFQ